MSRFMTYHSSAQFHVAGMPRTTGWSAKGAWTCMTPGGQQLSCVSKYPPIRLLVNHGHPFVFSKSEAECTPSKAPPPSTHFWIAAMPILPLVPPVLNTVPVGLQEKIAP